MPYLPPNPNPNPNPFDRTMVGFGFGPVEVGSSGITHCII